MAETPADVVTWTLERASAWGRTAHRATARCPHGTTVHILFGRPDVIAGQARDLAAPHTTRAGCSCVMGPVTIDGVAIGGGPP